jgi:hypothetical protein
VGGKEGGGARREREDKQEERQVENESTTCELKSKLTSRWNQLL